MIGGSAEVIDKFEKRFGGADALRQMFSSYVDQMRVGSGLDDVKWAQDYLQRWSGLGLAYSAQGQRVAELRRAHHARGQSDIAS